MNFLQKLYKTFPVLLTVMVSASMNSEAIAQTEYSISLQVPETKIFPKLYYPASVIDRRVHKSDGNILSSDGKKIPVTFETDLSTSIFQYADAMISSDTNLAPVSILIEKLHFSDVGSVAKHTLSLEFKLSIVRYLEGQEISLYSTNGRPSFISTGVTTGLAEKLLMQGLDALLSGFEKYANENSEQPAFCNSSESILIYNDEYTNYLDADTIRWKEDYKLNWDDFQGKPDKSSPFSAQSNCMFAFKSMVEYKSGLMRFSIFLYPCFTKKASWVVPDKKQDALLQHEQLHFDICELYIRKLRKKISSMTFPIIEPAELIKVEFNQAWADYQQAQALYDDESQHGIIEKEQKRWEEYVKNQLKLLEDFATRLPPTQVK